MQQSTFASLTFDAKKTFGHALHDAGTAQGFESAHVLGHHLARIAVGLGLALSDGKVMIGTVDATGRQHGDIAIGRAFHLHNGAYRVRLQP